MEWHLDKKIIDFGFDDEDTIVIDWNDGRRSAFDPYPYMKGAMEKLLDEDYLKLAYLTGYGRSIAWPGNLDFGVQLLYEASVTDSSETPLPPRGPHMRWSPEALIVRLKFAEDGKILVDWSDGTVREFWPDGERFDAKTLYERSAVVGFEPSAKHLARGALR